MHHRRRHMNQQNQPHQCRYIAQVEQVMAQVVVQVEAQVEAQVEVQVEAQVEAQVLGLGQVLAQVQLFPHHRKRSTSRWKRTCQCRSRHTSQDCN